MRSLTLLIRFGLIRPSKRLRADNLDPLASSKSKGGRGARSAFLYTIAGGDARLLTYSTCLSCTLLSIARSLNPCHVKCDRYIQQALTTYDGDEDIYRGLRAGAKGYLLKDAEPEELFAAIRTVFTGKKYIPIAVGAKLADRMDNAQLSDRELEVIRPIVTGKCNHEISKILHISESTVKFNINNILGKLGVSERTQAAIIALKRGIVSL